MRLLTASLLLLLAAFVVVSTRSLPLPGPASLSEGASSAFQAASDYQPVPTTFPDTIVRPEFAEAFAVEGAVGTFALLDLSTGTVHLHDADRAATRFLPASTFKVPNALFALESGAVADTNEVFAWDGTERMVPAWNQDQTLGPALRRSAVWVFQEIARRIGEPEMQALVDRIGYGNADIGGGIDLFWLNGALRISALEQLALLDGLARGALPFSSRTQSAVRDIMTMERGALADGTPYILRAKTGWANAPTPNIGWWVGYVEHATDDAPQRYAFALNIDMPNGGADAPKRIRIARQILEEEGLLPPR